MNSGTSKSQRDMPTAAGGEAETAKTPQNLSGARTCGAVRGPWVAHKADLALCSTSLPEQALSAEVMEDVGGICCVLLFIMFHYGVCCGFWYMAFYLFILFLFVLVWVCGFFLGGGGLFLFLLLLIKIFSFL